MDHAAWRDMEREEGTLTNVRLHETSHEVTSSNGWSCGVSAEYGVIPKIGDTFVAWGSIGRPIRGQAINGRVLFYRTPAEQAAEDQRRSDEMRAQRIAEYESKRSDFDARVAELPAPLRQRVEGFRSRGGDAWRWQCEPYEMACCEEAAKLSARFDTAEDIKAFAKLGFDEQKRLYPQMGDGHSGNTWGFSIRLAWLMHHDTHAVPKEHAAFCALMGCKEGACWSTTAEAKEGERDA